MGDTVFAHGRSIACKVSSGKTIAAMPDVCLSPPTPPAGPVPIPYPNTAMASDTDNGSKTVQIGGDEVMLKDQSTFKKSMGDEAATKSLGMGVVSHQIQGTVAFVGWSMDVKFEGANIPRHLDLTLHNGASAPYDTPPQVYTDTQSVSPPVEKPCKSSCPQEPTKAQYDKVRSKSPTPEIRKAINDKVPKICAACGLSSPSLAADHIVPLKIISQMRGFACLSEDNQKEVANTPSNFVGLCKSCNSSKRDKLWHQWKGVKKLNKVWTDDIRQPARSQTNQQLKELKAKVK